MAKKIQCWFDRTDIVGYRIRVQHLTETETYDLHYFPQYTAAYLANPKNKKRLLEHGILHQYSAVTEVVDPKGYKMIYQNVAIRIIQYPIYAGHEDDTIEE